MTTYEQDHGFNIGTTEYLVSTPGHPDEVFDTQWGRITYKNWCQCEALRHMETNLRQCWIRQNPEGLIALVSLKQYQRPVEGEE